MEKISPIIKLCQEGMRMEREARFDDASALYMQAWNASSDDYERCVAAHFVSRHQDPQHALDWNMKALALAHAVDDDRVVSFYPSLYLCIGMSYERLADLARAKEYFDLASHHVSALEENDYSKDLQRRLSDAFKRLNSVFSRSSH